MSDFNIIQPRRWRSIFEFLATFWPAMVAPIVLILSVRFHHPWLGMAVFVGMAVARRWWWTCVFGLLNALAILGGFIGCAIAAIKILAD